MFSFSKSSTSNTTNNLADSYNTTLGKTEIISETGNTSFTLTTGADFSKLLPFAALACFALAAYLLFKR